jgi:nicotinate phosphoribosyltransferase
MIQDHAGLFTDMYELTMAQAYFRDGMADVPAVFDYEFRRVPFDGGFAVFAGLADFLDYLGELRFAREDLDYLRSKGFGAEFLDYLGRFRFQATVWSVREGEIIFPLEPVVRVEGRLLETQIIETAILNVLNFESLIATKATRLRLAAGGRVVTEFGLRRAQGPGGILASRAAVIGGCDSTSNVYSAWRCGLEPTGTIAHSFIESHADELTAFRRFAESHPDGCVLLVDTFDTLRSGVPHAIQVAQEMEARGQRLAGIRLDSGDLAYLSKHARQMLDAAGLGYVKIVASNLLDEHLVRSLLEQGAPIDMFGVGTRLATGAPDGALDGVYKLAVVDGKPRLKVSDTLVKTTLPGAKKIYRYSNGEGLFQGDAIALDHETAVPVMVHPYEPGRTLHLRDFRAEPLFVKVVDGGRRIALSERVVDIAAYARGRLADLPEEHKRFENPHIYRVGLSEELAALRDDLVRRAREGG